MPAVLKNDTGTEKYDTKNPKGRNNSIFSTIESLSIGAVLRKAGMIDRIGIKLKFGQPSILSKSISFLISTTPLKSPKNLKITKSLRHNK